MRSPVRLLIRFVVLLVAVAAVAAVVAAAGYLRRSDRPVVVRSSPAISASSASGAIASPNPSRTTAPIDASSPILPDSVLSPGAALPVTVTDICTPGYARKVRHVPAQVKRDVYAEYRIAHHDPGEFEVDHLVSLELGGSNAKRNLWPQSYRTSPWNARVKDALENELHRRVCNGSLDLQTAQRDIAVDWIAAYQKYFHRSLPPVRAKRRTRAR